MIKPNELRIGNKVKCSISNDHGIYTVLALPGWENGEVEFMVTINRCPKQTVPISKLRPIKLTTKILAEYNLNESETGLWSFIDNGIQKKSFRWITEILSGEKIKTPFARFDGMCDIYHLHRLQNLYYVLVNSELEYNFLEQSKTSDFAKAVSAVGKKNIARFL